MKDIKQNSSIFEKTYPTYIQLEEAHELILSEIKLKKRYTDIIEIKTKEAVGYVAAQDIYAKENIPLFDKSPYDGYAFRSEDTKDASKENPVILKIIEEIPAGSFGTKMVGHMEAVKILTGAPIPTGADTVIQYEKTIFTEKQVQIFEPCKSGNNIVRKGEDLKVGELIIKKGEEIEPADCALLVGQGIASIPVYEKVKASILCTGSELKDVDDILEPGKIRDTNTTMFASYVKQSGMSAIPEAVLPDDVNVIADGIVNALNHSDCLITTGGASVGDYDVMRDAVELAGGKVLFWKIQIKPGSAVSAGIVNEKPVIILSGNPSAAAVIFWMLAVPVLRCIGGYNAIYPRRYQVHMLNAYTKASKNRRMLAGRLIFKNGMIYFEAVDKQKNSSISGMKNGTVLLEIPAGNQGLEEDALCFCYDLEHYTSKWGMPL